MSDLDTCPGAWLRVTRNDAATLTAGGERFVPGGEPIPRDGYGNVRVRCDRPVAVVESRWSKQPVSMGLCSSCHDLEEDNRMMLAERQGRRSAAE